MRPRTVLDTSVVIVLARGRTASERLRSVLGIGQPGRSFGVSVVTLGETLAFAKKACWGSPKIRNLESLFASDLELVALDRRDIVEFYAEFDHYASKRAKPARPMGQNDLWIAATARALDAELATLDRDFDFLHEAGLLSRQWLDQGLLRTPAV